MPFSHAFQPIVDVERRDAFAYEALVRGPQGEPAGHVFAGIAPGELARFDAESRLSAVALAGRLGMRCHLSLNQIPRSLRDAEASVAMLLATADRAGVPAERLILEITEGDPIEDRAQFAALVDLYRASGIKVAIDDFGAGHSGLNLLADFQPDLIKLDMHLVRGIEVSGPRQSIARAILMVCGDLGIDVIAEGIETIDEYDWFVNAGVQLFQGFLLGRPGFERLPEPLLPALA